MADTLVVYRDCKKHGNCQHQMRRDRPSSFRCVECRKEYNQSRNMPIGEIQCDTCGGLQPVLPNGTCKSCLGGKLQLETHYCDVCGTDRPVNIVTAFCRTCRHKVRREYYVLTPHES